MLNRQGKHHNSDKKPILMRLETNPTASTIEIDKGGGFKYMPHVVYTGPVLGEVQIH
jgi:hypothetical protein